MPDDKKPLPKPPSTPFGRKKGFGDEENNEELIADKMGMAMAGGSIEEFMNKEIGDNANARKLASMMMGMSGMSPGGVTAQSSPVPPEKQEIGTQEVGDSPSTPPPEEMVKAAMSGDIKNLAQMLKKEHLRRQGVSSEGPPEGSPEKSENTQGKAQHEPGEVESIPPGDATPEAVPEAAPEAQMEKETLVKLIKIASDNKVSVDWVISRALKLYVRDYEGTGRI